MTEGVSVEDKFTGKNKVNEILRTKFHSKNIWMVVKVPFVLLPIRKWQKWSRFEVVTRIHIAELVVKM